MAICDGTIMGWLWRLGDASPTVDKACNNATRFLPADVDAEEFFIARSSAAVVACLLLAIGWPE